MPNVPRAWNQQILVKEIKQYQRWLHRAKTARTVEQYRRAIEVRLIRLREVLN